MTARFALSVLSQVEGSRSEGSTHASLRDRCLAENPRFCSGVCDPSKILFEVPFAAAPAKIFLVRSRKLTQIYIHFPDQLRNKNCTFNRGLTWGDLRMRSLSNSLCVTFAKQPLCSGLKSLAGLVSGDCLIGLKHRQRPRGGDPYSKRHADRVTNSHSNRLLQT